MISSLCYLNRVECLYLSNICLFKSTLCLLDIQLTMSVSAILTMESYWLVPRSKPFEGSQIEKMVNSKIAVGLLLGIILWRLSGKVNFWASIWAITMIVSQQTVKAVNTPTRRVLFMALACGVMRFFMEYSTKLISSLTVPVYPNSPNNLQVLILYLSHKKFFIKTPLIGPAEAKLQICVSHLRQRHNKEQESDFMANVGRQTICS